MNRYIYSSSQRSYRPPQSIRSTNATSLHANSHPTHFLESPERTMQSYFLTNQINPNPDKQHQDESWNVYTQTTTIAIDSRAREYSVADYLNFVQDTRNQLSAQGKWLDSYLFPNNFYLPLNHQYGNVKRIRLVSTTFVNTRSRTQLYIDDTNDHLFVQMAIAAPWLSMRYHVVPNMSLIDAMYLSCTMAGKEGTIVPFYQEIPTTYGVPRSNITDTVNETTTMAMMHGLTYAFSELPDGYFWSGGSPNFVNTTVSKNSSTDRELIAQSNAIKGSDDNYHVRILFRTIDKWTRTADDGTPIGDPIAVYQVVFQMNAMAYNISDPVLFIFGPNDLPSQEVIITRTDTNGLNPVITCTFDQRLFDSILRIEVHYEKVVYDSASWTTEPLVTLYMSTEQIELGTATINGVVTDLVAMDDFRSVQGVFGGFVLFDNVVGESVTDDGETAATIGLPVGLPIGPVIPGGIRIGGVDNVLTGTIYFEWSSGNLNGYVTSAINDTGTGFYFQVTGIATYETSKPAVYNNIRRYNTDDGIHYYGTFVQGNPMSIKNNELKTYIARTLEQVTGGVWSENDISDVVYTTTASAARLDIPYGAYTIDELLTVLSKSVSVMTTRSVLSSSYKEIDESRWYVMFVVAMQVPIQVTAVYSNSSYLLKFAVSSEPTAVTESVTVQLPESTLSFQIESDQPICGLYVARMVKNMYGDWEVRSYSPLEPFVTVPIVPSELIVPTIKTSTIPQYNYGIVSSTEIDGVYYNTTTARYFRASYIFPVYSTIHIPCTDVVIESISPELPDGFTYDENGIYGSSTEQFSSFHFVYFRLVQTGPYGRVYRYYQNVNLVNLPFSYNYKSVRLLVNTAFTNIEQLQLDAENLFGQLTASPFYKVKCDHVTDAGTKYQVEPGVYMSKLTGAIYGTPETEFDITLTVYAKFNQADFSNGINITLPSSNIEGIFEDDMYVTTIRLASVSTDAFYGNTAMMYTVYVNEGSNYMAWGTPVTIKMSDFISFHLLANDKQSEQLMQDLYFNYTHSRSLLTRNYLYGYYQPTIVSVAENTSQPTKFSFSYSEYTNAYRGIQYDQQEHLSQDPIYPLRKGIYGYASDTTRALNTYMANTASSTSTSPFDPISGTLWTAIPVFVVNEVDGFLFGGPSVAQYQMKYDSNGLPLTAQSIDTIDTVVDRIDSTSTRYMNILDVQQVLQDVTPITTISPVLYNRSTMIQDAVYAPTALVDGVWNQLTIESTNRPFSIMLGAHYNHIEPLVDRVLSEYDYYNFQDYVWLSITVDNYGEFENIYDVYTNRWYFAKIFFKKCEKRYDTSFNYFECPPYETRRMNYIQELNAIQVRIYDRNGNLFADYNSMHFNFSFILEIEYFVDDIRVNGVNTMRPDVTVI